MRPRTKNVFRVICMILAALMIIPVVAMLFYY